MTASNVVTVDGNCLRFSALLRAVAVAAGRASPEVLHDNADNATGAELVLPPTIAEARAQGRLILVAEDDEINKKVILRQLAVLGYAAEIASNGVEALAMWREGRYALLLSDLHMPEMDGYALVEAIRREEALRGLPAQERLPILALTANALRGEESRAQAAGMDAYLTKPLPLHLLKAAIMKWMPWDSKDSGFGTDSAFGEFPEQAASVQAAPVLDVAVLKVLVGDDPQTINEFLADYGAAARQAATALRAAQAADDAREIGAIAHRLKSSSRSVGALQLGDLCADLENTCRTGSPHDILQGITSFEVAWLEVATQIDDLLRRS